MTFFQYSRREERRIPTAVCKQRATQKTEKGLKPEGNLIFGQFIPLSSLTDHRGYATLIVRWNWLKSKHSIVIDLWIRSLRFDEPNYFYHITCRGQRKNPLFFSDDDFNAYYSIINNVAQDMDMEIYGYCLMRNHVHLLLRRRENSLEHFFRLVNTRYAMYFNEKYDLVGRVFQGRFKSSTVLDEQYLFYILHYIHNNPVKANLVEHPEDYPQFKCSDS